MFIEKKLYLECVKQRTLLHNFLHSGAWLPVTCRKLAGHDVPIIVRTDGGLDYLESGGVILGCVPVHTAYCQNPLT